MSINDYWSSGKTNRDCFAEFDFDPVDFEWKCASVSQKIWTIELFYIVKWFKLSGKKHVHWRIAFTTHHPHWIYNEPH